MNTQMYWGAVLAAVSVVVLVALIGVALRWVTRAVLALPSPRERRNAAAQGAGGRRALPPALLGHDPRTRLLGLAAACIVFTPLVSRVVRAAVRLVGELVARMPEAVLNGWREQAALCDLNGGHGCTADTALALVRASGEGLAAAVNRSGLASIPFALLIFFVALWMLSTAILNALSTRDEDGEPHLDLVELLIGKERWATRQNLLFFLILFIGTYLSIASIAAIPDLSAAHGATPAHLSPQNFDTKLDKLEIKKSGLGGVGADPMLAIRQVLHPVQRRLVLARIADDTARTAPAPEQTAGGVIRLPGPQARTASNPASPPADTAPPAPPRPLLRLASAVADTVAVKHLSMGTSPAGIMRDDADALRPLFGMLADYWNDQRAQHDSIGAEIERRSTYAGNLAKSLYADMDSTRRLREQRFYFTQLQNWYIHTSNDLRRERDRAAVAQLALERRLDGWSTSAAAYLSSSTPDSAVLRDLRETAIRLRYDDEFDVRGPELAWRDLPSRAEGLGVFQWVSGWLLQTDSLPLTLIVGMLGFGLLGAAASTFVREQSIRERAEAASRQAWYQSRRGSQTEPSGEPEESDLRPGQPLVLNLPSVVIRGGSAAIVVFLGVMGGLSVLSSDAEPNPYALLFTCLVGAVFSQKVWDWAENRFGLTAAPGGAGVQVGTVTATTTMAPVSPVTSTPAERMADGGAGEDVSGKAGADPGDDDPATPLDGGPGTDPHVPPPPPR